VVEPLPAPAAAAAPETPQEEIATIAPSGTLYANRRRRYVGGSMWRLLGRAAAPVASGRLPRSVVPDSKRKWGKSGYLGKAPAPATAPGGGADGAGAAAAAPGHLSSASSSSSLPSLAGAAAAAAAAPAAAYARDTMAANGASPRR